MKGTILFFSSRGQTVASGLSRATGFDTLRVEKGNLKTEMAVLWGQTEALVFVGALAIAVRAIAPYLDDKKTDPAVVSVSEDGKIVIPVTSGHLGGASDLARECASLLGAEAVATTSSDRAGLIAPDLLASRWSFFLEGASSLAEVNGRLVLDGEMSCWVDEDLSPLPLPSCYREAALEDAQVRISARNMDLPSGVVQLVPPVIVAGLGCRRDTGKDHLGVCLERALAESGFHPRALKEIRTVQAKEDEAGVKGLAEDLQVPLVIVPDEVLRDLEGPFSESAARKHLGIPGAAEPAAASGGCLLGPRKVMEGVTVAFARADVDLVGEVAVVGTGPGDVRYLTLEARETLEKADAIVGYRLYVEQLPAGWLENKLVESYGMGQEEDRVLRAIALAKQGYRVALVCGGDPILFGLGALARRLSAGEVPARIVPGLSAAQLAGAMVGAPYTNGLICLSLSDYLQSWDDVVTALEAAARSGMTTALYNPVRRDLDLKLAKVRECFGSSERRILLVRDAGRPGAEVREISLGELYPDVIDMRTLILFPGKGVSSENGLWLDRRGYRSEKVKAR